jgi:uncharacterized protein
MTRRARALREEARALGQTRPGVAAALAEVASLEERFASAHPDWLEARIEARRIRVGPCDRGLEEVWIGDDGEVAFADEGEAAARASGGRDGCVPAAGLALDLARLGEPQLAERLLAAYAGESDDYPLYRVIDCVTRHVACARARACLRNGGAERSHPQAADAGSAAAQGWLALALATSDRPLRPRVVVAFGGLVASGKSTVARALAERIGAPRIVGDHVRAFRMGATPSHEPTAAERLASLEPGFEERLRRTLLAHAACVLDGGRAVVLDAGFARAHQRGAARELAARYGAAFRFVECRVDEATARRRLAARDASPGDHGGWEPIYDAFRARWEAPGAELASEEHIAVDTTRLLAETLEIVAARLPPVSAGARA